MARYSTTVIFGNVLQTFKELFIPSKVSLVNVQKGNRQQQLTINPVPTSTIDYLNSTLRKQLSPSTTEKISPDETNKVCL